MKSRNLFLIFALFVAVDALPVLAANAALAPGTKLQVRITDHISSDTAKSGDTFRGTLAQPVVINGKTVFEKGTDVKGQVMQASSSGRLNSPGQLQLVLTSISTGWFSSSPVTVQPLLIKGGSHTKSNVAKIGGGTAAGAIIGGLAGGGKGAAIGAGVGAAGGTAVAAATGKREAVVESEALLTWTTADPRALSARNNNSAYRGNYRSDRESDSRDRDDDRYTARRSAHHGEDDVDDNRREADRDGDYGFSAHDLVILRGCMGDNYLNLPPGLAKRGSLPPGLERHLQRNGTLPPGLQKRVQPLPEDCEMQLPRLPHEWERVILGSQIILLDERQTIRDILDISGRD